MLEKKSSETLQKIILHVEISQKPLPKQLYSETSLKRTSFIAGTSLQRTLFPGTDGILVKLSLQNLYVADTL